MLLLLCIIHFTFCLICRWVWYEEVRGVLSKAILLVQTQKALRWSELSVWHRGERRSCWGRVCRTCFTWVQRKRSHSVKLWPCKWRSCLQPVTLKHFKFSLISVQLLMSTVRSFLKYSDCSFAPFLAASITSGRCTKRRIVWWRLWEVSPENGRS